jgi:TRAP-type uncharacterized transport system substrate-binding protein
MWRRRMALIFRVVPTKGSFENIQLLGAGKVDLAIVQLDALRFVSDVVKQQHGLDVFDSIKVVLHLYPEEIHVLAKNKDIQSFYHLEGKRLSVGTEGGGTSLTAGVHCMSAISKPPCPSIRLMMPSRRWIRVSWMQ